MLTPAAISLAVALGAPLALQLDAGLHLEARTRSADEDVQREEVLLDLTATPALELEARTGDSTLAVRYAPGVTLAHLGARTGTERRIEVLHDGRIRYLLEPSDAWHLALVGTGARGRTNLIIQGLRGDAPTGLVPTTTTIDYQRGSAELELLLNQHRRSRWILTGGIFTSGGTTTESRAALPVEHSLAAGLAYRWGATHLDELGFALAGRGSHFPEDGDRGAYATTLGTWNRRLAENLTAGLGAGAVWIYARGVRSDGVEEHTILRRKAYPAAEVTLTAGLPLAPGRAAAAGAGRGGEERVGRVGGGGGRRGGGRGGGGRGGEGRGDEAATPAAEMLRAEAAARLGAGIDRLTAEVSQQAEGSATLAWDRPHGISLAGRAYGTVAWQQLGRAETLGLELRAGWAANTFMRPEVGLYVAAQRPPGPAPSFTEYGVLVAVSLDAPRQTW